MITKAIIITISFFLSWMAKEKRVPGLPVRDCAASPNNLALRCPKPGAIDVKAKAISEHLALVPGPRQFVPFVAMPYAPTLLPLTVAHTAIVS